MESPDMTDTGLCGGFTVLVAPSGFKESIAPAVAAEAMARGVARAAPEARILTAPIFDGGEGFTEGLVALTGGDLHRVRVMGPLGYPVEGFFGMLGGSGPLTAVVEVAAAAGLGLVPLEHRNPTTTTSFGVGELILAALDAGAEDILLGCGDSGINDAGAGMAQALGVSLLDDNGKPLGKGGVELARLASIDVAGRDPRLSRVPVRAAVNWHNVLLGERGVSRRYGPQKGASPEQVERLEAAMETFAAVVRATMGVDVAHGPGMGASGGLGAGLVALLGGELHDRYELLMQYTAFEYLLAEADLVLTAEGAIDAKTPFGKVPSEVGRRARAQGVPVIALAGSLDEGCDDVLAHGIDAFTGILGRPCTHDEALRTAAAHLERAAESAVRMVRIGMRLIRSERASRLGFDQRLAPVSRS
jgi:glycerate 2-kinase